MEYRLPPRIACLMLHLSLPSFSVSYYFSESGPTVHGSRFCNDVYFNPPISFSNASIPHHLNTLFPHSPTQTFGALPLKGKILNVRVASSHQIRKNTELVNLCKALGLDFDKTYANGIEGEGLRYGKVMIMCDQDTDGSHIKGLVINFFQHYWPNLLKIDGFFQQFVTPLVKVRDKAALESKKKSTDSLQSFFSIPEYEEWRHSIAPDTDKMKKMHVKYYKGLGTNTAEEGKSYFRDLGRHKKTFQWGPGDKDAIDLGETDTSATRHLPHTSLRGTFILT
jgi:C-terminal associated domain of TOPRIM/Toprim domain